MKRMSLFYYTIMRENMKEVIMWSVVVFLCISFLVYVVYMFVVNSLFGEKVSTGYMSIVAIACLAPALFLGFFAMEMLKSYGILR